MKDGLPYKEHTRVRMSYFMTSKDGYMRVKFCDTCSLRVNRLYISPTTLQPLFNLQ